MKVCKTIPILLIVCLLLQGAVSAFAGCDTICCSERTPLQGKTITNQKHQINEPYQCCRTREPLERKHYSLGNTNPRAVSLCCCVEDRPDLAAMERALSSGLIRIEQTKSLDSSPDSSAGDSSPGYDGRSLPRSHQLSGSAVPPRLYLVNLSLLI